MTEVIYCVHFWEYHGYGDRKCVRCHAFWNPLAETKTRESTDGIASTTYGGKDEPQIIIGRIGIIKVSGQ